MEEHIVDYGVLFCITGEHVSSGCKDDPLQQLSSILWNARDAHEFHTIPQRLTGLMEALRKFCSRSLKPCQSLLRSLQATCLPLLCTEAGNVFSFGIEHCEGGREECSHNDLLSALCCDPLHFSWGHQVLLVASSDFTQKTKQTLPAGLQRATSLKAQLLLSFRRGRNKIQRSTFTYQTDKAIKTKTKATIQKKKCYF